MFIQRCGTKDSFLYTVGHLKKGTPGVISALRSRWNNARVISCRKDEKGQACVGST